MKHNFKNTNELTNEYFIKRFDSRNEKDIKTTNSYIASLLISGADLANHRNFLQDNSIEKEIYSKGFFLGKEDVNKNLNKPNFINSIIRPEIEKFISLKNLRENIKKKKPVINLEGLQLHEALSRVTLISYRNFLLTYKENNELGKTLLLTDALENTLRDFIFNVSVHESLKPDEKLFQEVNKEVSRNITNTITNFWFDINSIDSEIKTKKDFENFKLELLKTLDKNYENFFSKTLIERV